MKVLINNKLYQMGNTQYKNLLSIAKEQIPRGIYAVEKKGYAELMNVPKKTTSEVMREVRSYKLLGFKVYYNR